MTRPAVLGVAVLTIALARTAALSQETPGPATLVFGSDVGVVRLDVTVLGRDGRFATHLGPGDFELYEDDSLQAATSFVRRDLPVSIVLLLDASTSISDRLPLAQAAAIGFLETLRPEDEAKVAEFNDSVSVLTDTTKDRAALRRAVESTSASGTTALYNALYATLRDLPQPRRDAELRRRAILLLSDGEDTASLVWEEQVVELARRREATIHVIDVGSRKRSSNRSSRLLSLLSLESGGELHRPASIQDLNAVYSRIAEELRSQYTIGYVSSNPAQDARWRRIEVRVRGRRDLQARHRTGYYAVPRREGEAP